jgi:hypothetical protein
MSVLLLRRWGRRVLGLGLVHEPAIPPAHSSSHAGAASLPTTRAASLPNLRRGPSTNIALTVVVRVGAARAGLALRLRAQRQGAGQNSGRHPTKYAFHRSLRKRN